MNTTTNSAFFGAAICLAGCGCSLIAYGDETIAARGSGGKGGAVGVFPDEKITIGREERSYRLVVPKNLPKGKPAPLVFAFHGFLIDGKDLMARYSRLDDAATKHGFILVYPESKIRAWPLLAPIAGQDLAFFDALYKKATAEHDVDLNRVYLTGMSNGAYFSHLVASQRSDKIAAIACHSGGLAPGSLPPASLQGKYGVLLIHGAADSIVKPEESRKARDEYKKLKHPVELIEVPRQNHLWATRIGVNDKIWEFFQSHPKKSPAR